MAFCSKCGKEIQDGVAFCNFCGQSTLTQTTTQNQTMPQFQQTVNQQQTNGQQFAYQTPQSSYTVPPLQPMQLLQTLSTKMKNEAIIWFAIAGVQVLVGLINLIYGGLLFLEYEEFNTFISNGIFLWVVAALNIFNAKKDFEYSKDVLTTPVGVVAKFEPLKDLIIALVYNLFFGGVIGVVAIIYSFLTRDFVIKNKQGFNELEVEFNKINQPQVN